MKLRYRRASYIGANPASKHLEHLLDCLWDASRNPALGTTGEWRPAVDVYQTAGEVVVRAELAGVNEEDIEATVFSDVLVVSGERRWPPSGADITYHEAGIRYGPFRVEVFIPAAVDVDRATAQYENGFLTVSLPKTPASVRTVSEMSSG